MANTSDDNLDHIDQQITTVEALRAYYGEASERIQKLKFDRLDIYHQSFIREAPLCFIATASPNGVDSSPRGGEPGFVKIVDEQTLAIPDWAGNNRLDTLTNILLSHGDCGLVFLVPHQDAFLRVNGQAIITTQTQLLEQMAIDDKTPKSIILLTVKEAYFHCGRTLRRSYLWEPQHWATHSDIPSMGEIILNQTARIGLAAQMPATSKEADTMYKTVLGREHLYNQ